MGVARRSRSCHGDWCAGVVAEAGSPIVTGVTEAVVGTFHSGTASRGVRHTPVPMVACCDEVASIGKYSGMRVQAESISLTPRLGRV